jgi:acylphosphatase
MKHVDIVVEGCVQGVGFRWSARVAARQLGVSGFVRNRQDGSVALEAEGEDQAVDRFLEWCRHGPRSAVVDHVRFTPGRLKGYSEFEARL